MKKIKKLVIGIISLCLACSMLAGCGDKEPAETETSETTTESTTTSATTTVPEETTESVDFTIDTSIDSAQTGEYTIEVTTLKPNETVPTVSNVSTLNLNLEDYIKLNSDTVAWLYVPGTLINYPVMQKTTKADKFYYLDKDANKQYSKAGSLFADYRNVITGSSKSDNVIIYGHNMANGSYFGTLNNYKSLSFYKQNPIVKYNTTEKKSNYVVVACFYANTIASQDNGNIFYYQLAQKFSTQTEFNTWKNEVLKRSEYTSAIDFTKSDKYLTLSTCASVYPEGRWVVIAREIRDGETIDTNNIKENPSTYYPAKWYGMNG